jgi:translation initiation factor IF-1
VTKKNNHINHISKELSILVSMYGLSFMLNNKNTGEKKFFEYEFEFKNSSAFKTKLLEIIQERDILTDSFHQINIIHHNLLNTLIPETIFDKNHLSLLLKQNIKLLPDDIVLYNSISDFQLYNIYIPYRFITDYFISHKTVFNWHSGTLFLNTIKQIKKFEKQPPIYEIYLNIFLKDFQISIFKNDKLLLFNGFEYQDTDEFLYYLFYVMETLKIKEKDSLIYITGIDKTNEIIKNLQDFTNKIYLFSKKNPGKINNYILNAY